MGGLPGAGRARGRRHRHRGRARRRGHRPGRPRGAVVHPVLRHVSVVSGRAAQPVRPRRRSARRRGRVRRHLPDSGQGPERLPDDAAWHVLAVHGGAQELGGEDRPVASRSRCACLVGCGVTTGYGSAVRTADIRPGQDVAVVGVGGVGMSALQGAVSAGARLYLRHRAGGVEARRTR